MKPENLDFMIDHTLLKPDATSSQVARICKEARHHGFRAVCINPIHVKQVHTLLEGSNVATCSVIGFPLGATTTHVKVCEAISAINDGAEEIDMVMHIGALREGDKNAVYDDIASVANICHAAGIILKVIIETGLLTDEEIVLACKTCIDAKADFVKTSTGFCDGAATVKDVALMYATVEGSGLEIKASGGIGLLSDAKAMIKAGASRIGTSSGLAIMAEAIRQEKAK